MPPTKKDSTSKPRASRSNPLPVRLYLVTTHRAIDGPPSVLRQVRWPCTLLSYAYAEVERYLSQAWGEHSHILIDSGAFTAHTSGRLITPEMYCEWALRFQHRWGTRVGSIEFMSLDVIGDQEASWRNFYQLRTQGLAAIPIITAHVDLEHLDRALLEGQERIALGGLVPMARHRQALSAWLDACFARLWRWHQKTGKMPRVHLLGIASEWALLRYPCASADSSGWASPIRQGKWKGSARGLPDDLPRSGAHPSINEFALRSVLEECRELQDRVTEFWHRRGIDL